MLEVLERNELLDEAERLSALRDFQGLATLLQGIPEPVLHGSPELLHLLALAWTRVGACRRALKLLEHQSAYLQSTGNARHGRQRLYLQANCLITLGSLYEAEQLLDEVVCAATGADDQAFVAAATASLGVIADIRCNYVDAIAAFQRAAAAFQHLGKPTAIAGCHHNLGMSYRQLGFLLDAENHFDIAIDHFRQHGSIDEIIGSEVERAILRLLVNDLDTAEKITDRATIVVNTLNNNRLLGETLRLKGLVLLRRAQYDHAESVFQRALRLAIASGTRLLEAEVCEELARTVQLRSRSHESRRFTERARDIYIAMGALSRAQRVHGV